MARIDGSQRGALVSIESARRIARAVQAYEQGKRDDVAPRLKRAFDEGGDPVKIGRTTEKWQKGSTTSLELIYEDDCEDDGSSGSSGGDLLEAHNLSFDVNEDVRCVVALAGNGCWYLVAAESCPDDGSGSDCGCPAIGGQDLTTIEDYDPGKSQVLTHDNECLKWRRIVREEMVSDVRWNDGIVVEKRYFWLIDEEELTDEVIIESTVCDEGSGESS